MIVSIAELQSYSEFSGKTEAELIVMAEAVEQLVRAYTNNRFQYRPGRFCAESDGDTLYGVSPYIQAGDTVEISEGPNKGLYVVTEVGEDYIRVDGALFTENRNLVTRVVYPKDVKLGVLNLLKWEIENRDKVGVKSESLSRYSVTYYDQDAGNTVMGYPVSLLGFLKPYRKARF